MYTLQEKISNVSNLVFEQFPQFVQDDNPKFLKFIELYYRSLEQKYNPLDLTKNLIDYYSVTHFTKSSLVEKTQLREELTINDTTITVTSTFGFPETDGYILIDNEIIYYKTKTDTQFQNCVRGYSAFIFNDYKEVEFTSSSADIHSELSPVTNVAFNFVNEFLRRVKYEILPDIPEVLNDEINLSTLITNIKSFYLSKGTEVSHKFLFRILYNKKQVKLKIKPRGNGAELKILNYSGKIGNVQIVSGGQGYDPENPPLVIVYGSGTGQKNANNIRPERAEITISSSQINANTGTITGVTVENIGENYVGSIRAEVRERTFYQSQLVTCEYNGNIIGTGEVYDWIQETEELILNNITGSFTKTAKIYGIGFETPTATIDLNYTTEDSNPNIKGQPSVNIIPIDPIVELPRENLFKASSANYLNESVVKVECIGDSLYKLDDKNVFPEIVEIVQEADTDYNISQVTLSGNNIIKVDDSREIYEISLNTNRKYNNTQLISPASTVLTAQITSTSNFTITVEDASGFPISNGILYCNGQKIKYASRSANQFFKCNRDSSTTLVVGTEIVAYGRYKLSVDKQWSASTSVTIGQIRYYGFNLYKCVKAGTTSSTAPVHVSGTKIDGSAKWSYIGSAIHKYFHAVRTDTSENKTYEIRVLGLTSPVIIENSGALHNKLIYSITDKINADYSSPLHSSWNVNDTHLIKTAAQPAGAPSNSYIGITGLYEYEKNLYVSSSGIPKYGISNTALNQTRNYDIQKFVKRVKRPTGIIPYFPKSDSAISASKAIGITVDGIEIQSPKGNTINYGPLQQITIQDGGEYVVPTNETSFITQNYPKFKILKNGNQSTDIILENTSTVTNFLISAKINGINLNNLPESEISNISGFTEKPTITVIAATNGTNSNTYREAILDLSYKNGIIDSIIIKDSGDGYTKAPIIRISGGGKSETYDIPLINDDSTDSNYQESIVEFIGSIVSTLYTNVINVSTNSTFTSTSYSSNPVVQSLNGTGASGEAIVNNGVVQSITLVNEGTNYFVTPDVIIKGVGQNATAKAIINSSTGKIVSLNVLNGGQNYTINPIVQITAKGRLAVLTTNIKTWTFNIVSTFTNPSIQNIIDNYGGYVYSASDSDRALSGTLNEQIVTKQNISDSSNSTAYLQTTVTSNFETFYGITSTAHSPIIGWAYDGNPIYGRYGFSDPLNSSSSIIDLCPSTNWTKARSGGPSTTTYALGTFIEDFTRSSTSKLDEFNGRFCVTPEFPEGTYAYFASANFPYFVGTNYYSTPDVFNTCGGRTNDNIPKNYIRLNRPQNVNFPRQYNLNETTTLVNTSISSGIVDSIYVEYGGNYYKTGDQLVVDNTNTFGNGLTAFVGQVEGKEVDYSFNITTSIINNVVKIKTKEKHDLSVGDYVYIDYSQDDDVYEINLDNVNQLTSNISGISGKTLYSVPLNFKKKFKLAITTTSSPFFSFDKSGTDRLFDKDISVTTNGSVKYITINAANIITPFYLHVGTKIFQIYASSPEVYGKYLVTEINEQDNYFYIEENNTNILNCIFTNIVYSTKSKTATGPIKTVDITNPGSGYRLLPYIASVKSSAGSGAILQTNSKSIGNIKNVEYSSVGNYFPTNQNVHYEVNTTYTAKIENNFEIYEVEVIHGGSGYFSEVSVTVNNSTEDTEKCKFDIYVFAGEIISVNVIGGGYNFTREPELKITSGSGSGATLKAKIRRRGLSVGSILSNTVTVSANKIVPNFEYEISSLGNTNWQSLGAPSGATVGTKFIAKVPGRGSGTATITNKSKVLYFDNNNSTVELLPILNDKLKIQDVVKLEIYDINYGKIYDVNYPKIYVKSDSSKKLQGKFLDSVGMIGENSQRIIDSNYYQDFSYTIKYPENKKVWTDAVVKNTHSAGFKLFGKYNIENTRRLFDNLNEVFQSSLVFKISLNGEINLKLKTPPCNVQRLLFNNSNSEEKKFVPYNLVFGISSETIAMVTEVFNNATDSNLDDSATVEIISGPGFIIGEIILSIPVGLELPNSAISSYKKSLIFWNGILQQPNYSYQLTEENPTAFIPKFPLVSSDELIGFFFETDFDLLDSFNLVNTQSTYNLFKDNLIYDVVSTATSSNFIVSMSGVVQDPSTYTISTTNNTITFNDTVKTGKVFIYYHPQISTITLSGNASDTTFTMSSSVDDDCKLVVFYNGINQSELITDYTYNVNTNQITFSEELPRSDIFIFKVNEQIECGQFDLSGLPDNTIKSLYNICTRKNVTQKVESNNVVTRDNFYELEKEVLDGTVYATSTKVYGIDTKFRYSTPEYSSSFVEILDDLSSQFNGSLTSFKMTCLGGTNPNILNPATDNSLLVSINGTNISENQYYTSGSNIVIKNSSNQAYPANTKATVFSFNSSYKIKDSDNVVRAYGGGWLQPITNQFDGVKDTFALSKDGVPQYTKNAGDVFVIRDGVLQRPDTTAYTLSKHRITFVDKPQETTLIKPIYFVRQLTPTNHQNIVLDSFKQFDGNTCQFPITFINSNLYTITDTTNISASNKLFVFKNGSYETPTTDYVVTNAGSTSASITFTDCPDSTDNIFAYYNKRTVTEIGFTQASAGTTITLTYAGTVNFTGQVNSMPYDSTVLYTSDAFLVFVDGVLQSPSSWSYNSSTKVLTLGQSVNINTQTVKVYLIHANMLDNISMVTGTSTYNITRNSVAYTPLHFTVNSTIPSESVLVAVNGVVQHPSTYTISGTTITFNQITNGATVSLYDTAIGQAIVDNLSDTIDCVNDTFRILRNFELYNSYTDSQDILVSINGVVKQPGLDYTVTNSSIITFLTDIPCTGDDIFMIGMYNNQYITLTNTSGNTYTLSSSISTYQREGLVVSYNGVLQTVGNGFTFVNSNTITFDSYLDSPPSYPSNIWAYLFEGAKVLDELNTPFDNIRDKFRLIWSSTYNELLAPEGNPDTTVNNPEIPEPTGIIVTKNDKILDPGVDYTLNGPNKTLIDFVTPPAPTDVIHIKTFGAFRKLTSITSGFNGTTKAFNMTYNGNPYYPNKIIDRPRKYENQILVIRDGNLLSPIYDYYVDNNQIIFNVAPASTTSKIVLLDFVGTVDDIKVDSYDNQVSVGDTIKIAGEYGTRTVTNIICPTILETETYTPTTTPSQLDATGFSATASIQNGIVTSINVTNSGYRYVNPPIIRTIGSGVGPKVVGSVDENGKVQSTFTFQYPGYNTYVTPTVKLTNYAYVQRKQLLTSNEVRKCTKLSAAMNSSATSFSVIGTSIFEQNPPTITVSSVSATGSGASFTIFVSGGKVVKVSVAQGGSNYNDLDTELVVTGGGGSGCVLEPVINSSGSFTAVNVRNGGYGYDNFRVFIDNEAIDYTYVDSTTNVISGCTRGVAGSTASSHSINDLVVYDKFI
jgi:hypothetical protein